MLTATRDTYWGSCGENEKLLPHRLQSLLKPAVVPGIAKKEASKVKAASNPTPDL
jgi:hypothetical protein